VRLQFVLTEVLRGLRRNLAMVVSVVLVTFVSLAFLGAAALIRTQVDKIQDDLYDLVEVVVFLCPDGSDAPTCAAGAATDEQIATLQRVIDDELGAEVTQTHLQTKEQALAEFQERHPDGFHGTQLTADDMQASFRLKLADPSQYEVVSDVLQGRDGVELVVDQRGVFTPLFSAMNGLTILAAGLAVVMLLTAVLLITTTIRLSAVSRRRETGIMRLVGASNLFVQLPFLLEGAIAAVIGSLLAVGGLWLAVRYLVADWLHDLVGWIAYVTTSDVLALAPLLVGIAVALAVVSSVVTLHRYTRV
jgi:cell division transport system permease protein